MINARNTWPSFWTCGIRIDAVTAEAAVSAIRTITQTAGGKAVHLCNAYTLALATRDSSLSSALNMGDLNLPDGTPVAWVGRLRGQNHLAGPVRGPSLMLAIIAAGIPDLATHYLYGSTGDVLQSLQSELTSRFPGVRIAGVKSPPFRDLTPGEKADFISEIEVLKPDYIWVGLGTPRQDHFIAETASEGEGVFIAVGAAFDFIAGSRREAPTFLHGSGLEWIFRLLTEPRRLWRRYVFGNVRFILHAWRIK